VEALQAYAARHGDPTPWVDDDGNADIDGIEELKKTGELWAAELDRRERLPNPNLNSNEPDMSEPNDDAIWRRLTDRQKQQVKDLFRKWFAIQNEKFKPINDKARELVRKWRKEDIDESARDGQMAPKKKRLLIEYEDKLRAEREKKRIQDGVPKDYRNVEEFEVPKMPPDDVLIEQIAQVMYREGTEEAQSYAPNLYMEHMMLWARYQDQMEDGELPHNLVPVPRDLNNLPDFKWPKWLKDALEEDEWMPREPVPFKYPPEVPTPRL